MRFAPIERLVVRVHVLSAVYRRVKEFSRHPSANPCSERSCGSASLAEKGEAPRSFFARSVACTQCVEHVSNREKVAERFRHFLVVDVDETIVHPDLRQRCAVRAFGLRDLVFVVGNCRSAPPPWISKVLPKWQHAIAEHSMCQPGRPSPQRESHRASCGSSGFARFHKTKSRGSCLLLSIATRSPARNCSSDLPDNLP